LRQVEDFRAEPYTYRRLSSEIESLSLGIAERSLELDPDIEWQVVFEIQATRMLRALIFTGTPIFSDKLALLLNDVLREDSGAPALCGWPSDEDACWQLRSIYYSRNDPSDPGGPA
jgi:hypothetical protein